MEVCAPRPRRRHERRSRHHRPLPLPASGGLRPPDPRGLRRTLGPPARRRRGHRDGHGLLQPRAPAGALGGRPAGPRRAPWGGSPGGGGRRGDAVSLEALRFPIGRFRPGPPLSPDERAAAIDELAALPGKLRAAVSDLDDARLDTPYRPDGWTVRQLVHHVPDSHLNSYIRFKWAMSEERPAIKVYDQDAWAGHADSRTAAVAPSLDLLEALHARWTAWLRTFTDADWERELVHPESGTLTLDAMLQLYRWHSAHHLAHVTRLRERMGW
ncbi:MAG: putative metal-dependent hydrolase [Gemmatimonadetes bacterium]|nr:putative metal-dependent hydrolase [Gemmatimonadota bacterium]